MVGEVLSAKIMGLVATWNHPPLFDYIVRQASGAFSPHFTGAADGFHQDMYNLYWDSF